MKKCNTENISRTVPFVIFLTNIFLELSYTITSCFYILNHFLHLLIQDWIFVEISKVSIHLVELFSVDVKVFKQELRSYLDLPFELIILKTKLLNAFSRIIYL